MNPEPTKDSIFSFTDLLLLNERKIKKAANPNMVVIDRDVFIAILRKAYMAGFNASAEGFNGEYGADKDAKEREYRRWFATTSYGNPF